MFVQPLYVNLIKWRLGWKIQTYLSFTAISKDLPFAHARFCTTEGIENVIPLSDFRYSDFDESYGVRMADGPLAGLLARSVVVIGKDGKIAYTELVPEVTQEPDYDKALAAVKE